MKKFARWLFMKYYKVEIRRLNEQSSSMTVPSSMRVGIKTSLETLDLLED